MSDDKMSRRFSRKGHELELVAEARAVDRQRKEATVQLTQPRGTAFTVVCDEGAYLDGDDAAPPPLAYLTSAIAF